MTIAKMPVGKVVEFIGNGIQLELKNRIQASLMEQATKIVEEVSTAICKDLLTKLHGYESFRDGDVNITLVIDRVKKEIK